MSKPLAASQDCEAASGRTHFFFTGFSSDVVTVVVWV